MSELFSCQTKKKNSEGKKNTEEGPPGRCRREFSAEPRPARTSPVERAVKEQ